MSPSVGNFVHDLVEMAKATERLPILEDQVREYEAQKLRDGETIARLEIKLMERSAEISELQTKLRSVEAERDDAGFRCLEAEDKVDALRRLVKGFAADAGTLLNIFTADAGAFLNIVEEKIEEVKAPSSTTAAAVPDASPEASVSGQSSGEGQSALDPTSVVGVHITQTDVSSEPAVVQGTVASTEGQSASHPIPQPTPDHAPTEDAEFQRSAPLSDTAGASWQGQPRNEIGQFAKSEPIHGRFFGLRYHSMPGFIPREEWLAGGGTEADYDWHPLKVSDISDDEQISGFSQMSQQAS